MSHYICKGGNCKTVSEKPSVCLEPSCVSRYKLLNECGCGDARRHHFGREHSHASCCNGGDSRIDAVNFGVATGVSLGIFVGMLGLAGTYVGWGMDLIYTLGTWFLGFDATPLGSAAGGLWAFIDGFIVGAIIAWVYNGLSKVR